MFEKVEKEIKDIVCIQTICSNVEEAKLIGISAIKERLAISVDYSFINSIYPWGGIIREATQCLLVFSTQKMLSEKLIRHIESKSSYNVPVITRYDTSMVNKQYNFWAENILANNKETYMTEAEAKELRKQKEKEYYRLK